MQVTICAQADLQLVPLEIIFRGKGCVKPAELAYYESLPGIKVRFQKKAWADGEVMMDWMADFREATIEQGEVLLGMDNHGAQRTLECESFMALMDIVPAYTPANCTDCVSPVDCNVGITLKRMINKRFEAEFAANYKAWCLPARSGGLSRSDRRHLIAKWASDSWTEFCSDKQALIRSAFVNTGFLVAKDGSENRLIKLWKHGRGLYDF